MQKEYTIEELKVIAFDSLRDIERLQGIVNEVSKLIAEKEKAMKAQPPVTPPIKVDFKNEPKPKKR